MKQEKKDTRWVFGRSQSNPKLERKLTPVPGVTLTPGFVTVVTLQGWELGQHHLLPSLTDEDYKYPRSFTSR